MTDIRARWDKGPSFAEVAEALDVNTDQIMAMMPRDGVFSVLYSPLEDESERIFYATLSRDRDGILRLQEPAEEIPGMWEQIVSSVEGRLS